MSDVLAPAETFLDLWLAGRATRDNFEDHVEDWHEGGHGTEPSLARYLGFREDEFDVFIMALDALPMIAKARRGEDTLENLVRKQLADVIAANNPKHRGIAISLSAWLAKRGIAV